MISKNYDKDIVLYKNGKYKELSHIKKVKNNRVNKVLYSIHSNLYGNSYVILSAKVYNKLRRISNIKFSYNFLDGELADDTYCTEESMTIRNTYYYDTVRELFAKLYEILMCENCLNDFFWVFNSFWSFAFHGYKISLMYNGKKYKFKSIEDFYKFIFGRESIFPRKYKMEDTAIRFGDKRYKFNKGKDIEKKLNKNNQYIFFINKNQAIPIKASFFSDFSSCKVETKLLCTEMMTDNEYETYVRNNITYELHKHDIAKLYILTCAKSVVEQLESSNEFTQYNITYKLISKNSNKKGYKKMIKKYFPELWKYFN